jgi:hypothetical protein
MNVKDEREPSPGPSQPQSGDEYRQTDSLGLGARSILLSLDSDRRAAVQLDDLEEGALPELKEGSSKYQILGRLGEGGMGVVYLAYDQDLKRRIALKMIGKLSPSKAKRFLEEAQVMAQLQHPAIVPLFDVGMTEGGNYKRTCCGATSILTWRGERRGRRRRTRPRTRRGRRRGGGAPR